MKEEAGSGIRQQLSLTNQTPYKEFSVDSLEKILRDLSDLREHPMTSGESFKESKQYERRKLT